MALIRVNDFILSHIKHLNRRIHAGKPNQIPIQLVPPNFVRSLIELRSLRPEILNHIDFYLVVVFKKLIR